MMPGTILIVTYYYPPVHSIATQRTLALSRTLVSKGWNTHVLTIDPVMEGFAEHKIDNELLSRIPQVVKMHRIASRNGLLSGRKNGLLGKAEVFWRRVKRRLHFFDPQEDWMRAARKAILQLLAETTFDIIFISVPPHSLLSLAAQLARRSNARIVTDFRDNWILNDQVRFPTPLHRLLAVRTERDALQCSALVCSVQKDLLASPHIKLGLHVPNGYVEEYFPAANDVNRPTKLTVAHFGSLYGNRNPEPTFRAVQALHEDFQGLEKILSVEFWGWSWNTDFNVLADRYGTGAITRDRGVVPYRESLMQMCSADVLLLLIPEKRGGRESTVFTGKLFEYLFTGNPILAMIPVHGAAADIILAQHAGWIVAPTDWQGTRDVLRAEVRRFLSESRRPVKFRPVVEYSREALNAGVERALAGLLVTIAGNAKTVFFARGDTP